MVVYLLRGFLVVKQLASNFKQSVFTGSGNVVNWFAVGTCDYFNICGRECKSILSRLKLMKNSLQLLLFTFVVAAAFSRPQGATIGRFLTEFGINGYKYL